MRIPSLRTIIAVFLTSLTIICNVARGQFRNELLKNENMTLQRSPPPRYDGVMWGPGQELPYSDGHVSSESNVEETTEPNDGTNCYTRSAPFLIEMIVLVILCINVYDLI
ncbi:uncharacterized protein [Apostichopus japonicus]|uniref:uncharacterized protein n=1 Tax=Stichopus japonicus TaxID=307972 RepID=UPI003AB119E7